MSGLSGFGRSYDIWFTTLWCRGKLIIDSDCNLKIPGKAKIRQKLTTNDQIVKFDHIVNGNIFVTGNIIGGNIIEGVPSFDIDLGCLPLESVGGLSFLRRYKYRVVWTFS